MDLLSEDMDEVKRLIEIGTIHIENEWPLRWTSTYGFYLLVELLLKMGADVHAENDYALRHASSGGHLEVVKILVKAGADIHTENDEALRYACLCDHFDVVSFLIDSAKFISNNVLLWSINNPRITELLLTSKRRKRMAKAVVHLLL